MTLDLVEIRTSDDLIAVIKARRVELGLKQLDVDDIAGLQGGYTGKIECGSKGFGPMSLTALMGALGLVLKVERSPAPFGSVSAAGQIQSAHKLKKIMAFRGAKGGRRAWGGFLPDERAAAMRKLGIASGRARRNRAKLNAAQKENGPDRPME